MTVERETKQLEREKGRERKFQKETPCRKRKFQAEWESWKLQRRKFWIEWNDFFFFFPPFSYKNAWKIINPDRKKKNPK